MELLDRALPKGLIPNSRFIAGYILFAAVLGRVPLFWALIAMVLIALPFALLIAGGRAVAPGSARSDEAERLLTIACDILNAQELPEPNAEAGA